VNIARVVAALRELADAFEEAQQDPGAPAPKKSEPRAVPAKVDEVGRARARKALRRHGVALEEE